MGGAAVGAVGVYLVYKHYCKKVLPFITVWALLVSASSVRFTSKQSTSSICQVVALRAWHP